MNKTYKVFNNHQIGASHIQKGMDCEDYSDSYLDEDMAICVISDGHGDKNCFRSAMGAKIACEAAIRVVRNTFGSDYQQAVANLKMSPHRTILEIEKSIIYEWNESVQAHLQNNPFSEDDLKPLDPEIKKILTEGKKGPKVYGCTLIMCVVLGDVWFGIQVGDGKCVVINENGTYEQPIPWDQIGCVGNRSTSICASNAIESFRYYYGVDSIPVALFVASDGVDESFEENGLNKCYHTLSLWIKNLSEEECKSRTDELLKTISGDGSGDDVSVACIINTRVDIKRPYVSSAQVAEKMQEIYDALKDSEQVYKERVAENYELRSRKDKLLCEVEEYRKLLREKEPLMRSLEERIKENEDQLDDETKRLKEYTNRFLEAKKLKTNVDKYWESFGVVTVNNDEIMKYIPYLQTLELRDITSVLRSTDSVDEELDPDKLRMQISNEKKYELGENVDSDDLEIGAAVDKYSSAKRDDWDF